MTTTPLPSYGIWTTDIDGKRVMGFTPEQFLTVWQARADLEAENKRLREVLRNLLNDTQHAEHPDCDDGPCPVREARAALEKQP